MLAERTTASGTHLGLWTRGRRWVIGAGLAIAAYAIVGMSLPGDLLFVEIGAIASAAVVVGIRFARPVVRSAWIAVAAALVCLSLGNLITMVVRHAPLDELRAVADGFFFAAYLPLFFAAFRFGRAAQWSDRTILLDTGVVGLAAAPLVWELLVEPRASLGGTEGGAILALAIPLVDVLLVSLAAPLLLLRDSRTSSAYLFVGALLAMGLGDTLYAMSALVPDAESEMVANLAWLSSYVMLGAAALVPSAGRLGTCSMQPCRDSGDTARLVATATALLVAPLVLLHETLDNGDAELVALATLAIAIAALVVFRLQRTIAELADVDRRFRRFMSHPGFMAAIKDAAGRFIYVNPTAVGVLATSGPEWFDPAHAGSSGQASAGGVRGDPVASGGRTAPASRVGLDDRIWHMEQFELPGSRGSTGILGLDITTQERAFEQARLQARLLESVRDAVIVVDLDGVTRYWNEGARAILGYSAKAMLGRRMDRLVPVETEGEMDALWEGIRGGRIHSFDWRAKRRDGRAVWLDVRVGPLSDEHGVVTGFLGVAKDVTERKEAELALARLGAVVEHATDGVILTDANDRTVYVNPAFERITGFASEDVRGRPVSDIPATRGFARSLAKARLDRDDGWRGDVVGRRRDGSDLVCETSISPVVVSGQDGPSFVTILRDVTRERAAERSAERRARERGLIAETLSTLRADVSPEETAAAICGQLVKVEEVAIASVITFGADGTATVLGQVHRSGAGRPGLALDSARSGYLRERGLAGPWVERWKVAPSHPYGDMFAELGIEANAYAPILLGGRLLGLLVAGSDHREAVERMTERLPALVEFAAITATLLGGALVTRNAAAEQRAQLRAMISAGGFEPVFQPIVELGGEAIRGYEALTRFADGTPPSVRFEVAHRLGIGLELERATLLAVFEASEGLPQGTWLNVNVSPELVLAGMVEDILPTGSREVVLEVTEHQAITDYESFRLAMQPMHDRVSLAVDDAGAGFSSLRHIVELTPAMVKLDRSLIERIHEDHAREAVVAGMVRFAQSAGHVLLAEGIETAAELATLRRLGVALGQGFLFGRPAPASEFVAPVRPAAELHGRRPTRPRPARADGSSPAALAAVHH